MSKDSNADVNFFGEKYLELIMASMAVIQYGKVVRYDSSDHTADVQPLALQSDGSKRAMLMNCDVVMSAREWYETGADNDGEGGDGGIDIKKIHKLKAGDIVVVGFNDRDTDNFTKSGNFSLASRRMHSIQDGVVLGVLV